MPKAPLIPEESILEHQLIETMLASFREWRPDLSYPESHSDMEACARGIMRMFETKRLPLPRALHTPCHDCRGLGLFYTDACHAETCKTCKGRGKLEL